jgi:hypothetical protein
MKAIDVENPVRFQRISRLTRSVFHREWGNLRLPGPQWNGKTTTIRSLITAQADVRICLVIQ